MRVVAIHRISDPERFHEVVGKAMAEGPPEGWALPVQINASDGRTQVCVWDAPSVEAVKELVDSSVGGLAENEILAGDLRHLEESGS